MLASQAKLEGILNSIGGVVWEADAGDRKVNFVSRPFESMFGYRVEQWLQDRDFWLNLVFSADRNLVLETYGEAVGRGGRLPSSNTGCAPVTDDSSGSARMSRWWLKTPRPHECGA